VNPADLPPPVAALIALSRSARRPLARARYKVVVEMRREGEMR
jgi:hypothetical protein